MKQFKLLFSFILFLLLFCKSFAITTPVINPHPRDHDGNYTISWSEATDPNGIARYELQEATTAETVVFSDSAESGLGSWEVLGFLATTEAAHGGSYSFYSGRGNNLNNFIKTNNPIRIDGAENLTFWIKYDTESGFDYLYVQVSTNGTTWTELASYDGYQGTFIRKSYSLASFAGSSIYIRFKYYTDSSVSYNGAYIDDIAIENGLSYATLSSTITSTSYNFTGKPYGKYWYHVRAQNNLGIWGNYSLVASVEVGPDIYPPSAPNLSCSSVVIYGSDITLTWTEPDDDSGIVSYELQELSGQPGVEMIDDAESGISLWNNNGFSISTSKAYSPSHSLYSGSGDGLNNSLTSKGSFPIAGTERLKFWCSYSLESSYDEIYVQLSIDGLNWNTLDVISGYQTSWIQKSYSLSAYAGKNIYIRFKYVTDYSVASSGFYVDDIVLDGGGAATWISLGNSITTRSYNLSGKGKGFYRYRIRAKDGAGYWGSYSSAMMVTVADSSGVDLSVSESDISIFPERCAEGGLLVISAKINNLGAQYAYSFVEAYHNQIDLDHRIGYDYLDVNALSSSTTSFDFDTTGKGKDPIIYILATALTTEANTSNNQASKKANVISFFRPTFCYPNPFDPSRQTTKFVYRLDTAADTQIVLFDIAGRIVWRKSFLAGTQGAQSGLNEVEWNGIADYSEMIRNGVYIYKILDKRTGRDIFTGKLLVLR
jgi:hypothetical protein